MVVGWFRIDRAWVERREAALIAWEDALCAAARDRATGEERAFFDELLRLRALNARAKAGSYEHHPTA